MSAPYYVDDSVTLWRGSAATVLAADELGYDYTLGYGTLRMFPDASVDCIVTSPPYWGLRDYGVDGQLGHEPSPSAYVEALRGVFAELARVMVPTGTCWLNLGDSYAAKARGSDVGWRTSRLDNPGAAQKAQAASMRRTGERHRGKSAGVGEKNLFGIPWRVAFALQDDGWTLRNAIVWHKPNSMPESVTDRLSTRHEELFLLTRSTRYHFDLDAIREPHSPVSIARASRRRLTPDRSQQGVGSPQTQDPAQSVHSLGRNPGDVWSIPTTPSPHEHYAAFPAEIPRRCIAAGCPDGGVVLDPFSGTGTTGEAARQLGRRYIGIDLSAQYLDIQVRRFAQAVIA